MNLRLWVQLLVGSLAVFSNPSGYGEKGLMEGILSAKGDTWIEVLDDGDFLHRFIPQWIGEGPANGGSFNKETIKMIRNLVVGNRVQVSWLHDGHLRVLGSDVLVPNYPEGMFVGYVLKTSNRWIDVQNIEEGKPWRFYLPWVGGYPSEGGGYDRKVLSQLKEQSPTDPVRFSWEYKARPTIVSVYEKIHDKTTPFWVGKKLPEPRKIRVTGKAETADPDENKEVQASPFDMLKPKDASPFDMLPPKTGSPFDMMETKRDNPFEKGSAQPGLNPFEKSENANPVANPFENVQSPGTDNGNPLVNPFENMPLPQKSPFELMNGK